MTAVVSFPAFTREATVSGSSFRQSPDGARIDVIWTAGAVVRRRTFGGVGEFDEELVVSPSAVRLQTLNSGAVFLDSHGAQSVANVIGRVLPGSASISGGRGTATIRLSRADADQPVVQKIRDGLISSVSVGYRVHAAERVERQGNVPLHRVTDWEPYELSAVAIGADPDARITAVRAASPLYPCIIGTRGTITPGAAARMRMHARQAMSEASAPTVGRSH